MLNDSVRRAEIGLCVLLAAADGDVSEQEIGALSSRVGRLVGDEFPVIAASIAYEGEIAGFLTMLEAAGIPPLREERDERHPRVIAGGPLTFSNPLPLAPFVDAILMGEADAPEVPLPAATETSV